MAGLLGQIFSAGNVAKRQLRDLLGNPVLSAQQMAGNLNDRARNLNEMTAAAAREGMDYGPASQRLAGLMAEGYNPVGMFIGPTSKMFNRDMALKASQMEKKGAKPQEIWQTTGTVKGPDGQWRQEISDAQSTIVPQQKKALDWLSEPGPAEYPVGSINDLIQHQEVLKAYPDLANIRASLRKGESASYFPNDGFNERIISPALVRQGELANPQATRSSTLHELQHAIQQREQFASGGSADDFAFMRDEAMGKIKQLNANMSDIAQKLGNKSLSEQEKQLLLTQYQQAITERADLVPLATVDPRQAYGNLMGEAEARLTQRRMDLTPEQRMQNFPFEYTGETGYGLDVPLEGLIQMDADGTIIRRGLLGSSPTSVQRSSAQSLLENAAKNFETSVTDASEIFGQGSKRIKYTDPNSGGVIDVLQRPDGTASVLGLEVPEAMRGQGIGQSLQSQVMQDFPEMMGQVSSKAAAKTAYRLGRRPPSQPDATLDDVYKIMDEYSSVNLVSPEMQKRMKQSLLD